MSKDMEMCANVFLKEHEKLIGCEVLFDVEEAAEFLENNDMSICESAKEVREYLETAGADISGVSDKDVIEETEVFKLPDGRFFVVMA